MLALVKDETERIDSRFLEPAYGSSNFLVVILRRKLAAVEKKYGKSDFEKRHYALLALTVKTWPPATAPTPVLQSGLMNTRISRSNHRWER